MSCFPFGNSSKLRKIFVFFFIKLEPFVPFFSRFLGPFMFLFLSELQQAFMIVGVVLKEERKNSERKNSANFELAFL